MCKILVYTKHVVYSHMTKPCYVFKKKKNQTKMTKGIDGVTNSSTDVGWWTCQLDLQTDELYYIYKGKLIFFFLTLSCLFYGLAKWLTDYFMKSKVDQQPSGTFKFCFGFCSDCCFIGVSS